MVKLVETFVNVAIAVGIVYLLAWILNTDVNSIVGWVALGMIAGQRVERR